MESIEKNNSVKKKKLLTAIYILFLSLQGATQADWELISHIERIDHFQLEGKIDEKYPITMHLTFTGRFCGGEPNNRWNARELKGWYYYDNVKKKIPLVGAMDCSDPDHFVKLFVPESLSDTINGVTCDMENYREMFIVEECYSYNNMNWKTKNQNDYSSVNLKTINTFNYEAYATILFYWRGLEMVTFDLVELTKNSDIDRIEILATKELNNHYFAIIGFGHPTIPGSSGAGHCGAGYEEYLGFMEINEQLELEKFKFYKTGSCLECIDEDKYGFEVDFPEKGIIVNK